jgi:outer membrane protein
MWKALLIIVTLLTLISYGTTWSQDVDTSKPLNLDQCIKIALEQSSNMKLANLDLKSVKLNLEDARAGYYPSVDVSGQYQFSDKVDFGWDKNNYNAQLNASYNIWDSGRRKTSLEQAKANQRVTKAGYDGTIQSLIYNLTQSYYDLLQAEKIVLVDEKLLEISRTSTDKVKAFQEAGRSIPADVAASKAQQSSDELTLLRDKNSVEIARSNLASIMGLNPGLNIEIEDDPDYETYIRLETQSAESVLALVNVSLDESIKKALQTRPELVQLKNRLASQEWSLRLTQIQRYPTINADAGYNIMVSDYLRDKGAFNKYRSWDVQARVSFPLFDAGSSKRQEQKAEIALEQIKENIRDRERSIMLDVQQAYLNLERAKKGLDISREQVRNAFESLNVTQGRYEQNMSIFLEVLSAQSRYAQALTNQVKSFYDYKLAEKALQKAIGTVEGNK